VPWQNIGKRVTRLSSGVSPPDDPIIQVRVGPATLGQQLAGLLDSTVHRLLTED
jgi:hypothetical protein